MPGAIAGGAKTAPGLPLPNSKTVDDIAYGLGFGRSLCGALAFDDLVSPFRSVAVVGNPAQERDTCGTDQDLYQKCPETDRHLERDQGEYQQMPMCGR